MKYWSYTVWRQDDTYIHNQIKTMGNERLWPLVSDLSREATEKAKPEVHHGEGKILVEKVAEKAAHSQIRPATVHQQQPL